MITPAEIREKAERKYLEVLRSWLNNEPIFPLRIPANLTTTGSTPAERVKELELLLNHSAEITGKPGYSVDKRVVNTQGKGTQTLPQAIIFHTEQDYIVFIEKEIEFRNLKQDCELIRNILPALEHWVAMHPKTIIKYSGSWPAILEVCQYFVSNPQPAIYVRQLPLQSDTKFIERHEAILRNLLEQVLPSEMINLEQDDFYNRFGLLKDDAKIRFRILDKNHHHWFKGLTDISVPVQDFAELDIDCTKVLVVENSISFLTLPELRDTIAIFGSGNAAVLLVKCKWLSAKRLFYWGDIDLHGLAILARLRQKFPNLQSLFMNKDTYEAHKHFAHKGKLCKDIVSEYLSESERELCCQLQSQSEANRIEQEKLEKTFVENELMTL